LLGTSLDSNRVYLNATEAAYPVDLADCIIAGDFVNIPRGSLIEQVFFFLREIYLSI
jgi:hypothetical protein